MWGDWHFKQTPPLLGEMEKADWAGNWLGKIDTRENGCFSRNDGSAGEDRLYQVTKGLEC